MKFLTRKGFLIEEQGIRPTPIWIQRSGPCGRQLAPTALRWGPESAHALPVET